MSTEITNKFADRIRPWFPEDSYRKVARGAGITPEAVRRWLKGDFIPGHKNLEKLATLTGKSVNWLLTGKDDKEASASPPPFLAEFALQQMSRRLDALTEQLRLSNESVNNLWIELRQHIETSQQWRKNAANAIDRQGRRIDTAYKALVKAEEQKDFLPLRILAGKK